MSIDYDKIRRELDEMEAGVHVTTRYTWADLAHELLHLRDEIETIRDRCTAQAKKARAADIHFLAREIDTNAEILTLLLQGDTE